MYKSRKSGTYKRKKGGILYSKRGGDLRKHKLFSKIISIGYEFESHGISKLSFYDGTLINSDLTMRMIKNVTKEKVSPSTIKVEMYNQFTDKNDEYDEYTIEPEKDGLSDNYETPLYITNDRTKPTLFEKKIEGMCNPTQTKNNIMIFQDKNKKVNIPIKFAGTVNNERLGEFSGVEFIVTYHHPIPSNNIILETYTDACMRIINHLTSLDVMEGNIMINVSKPNKKPVYKPLLDHNLYLLNKPNTNLFYIQTDVREKTGNFFNHLHFTPQFTFKTKAEDFIEVCYQLANFKDTIYANSESKDELDDEDIYNVEMFVIHSLNDYSIEHGNIIGVNLKLISYLFIFMYKVYVYINHYLLAKRKVGGADYYLKDFLSFASRHGNDVIYKRIVDILMEELKVDRDSTVNALIDILNNESRLETYIYKNENVVDAITNTDLDNIEDEDQGNPSVSFLSYIRFLEDQGYDWFEDLDSYSTRFDLENDEVMCEYRGFMNAVLATGEHYIDPDFSNVMPEMKYFALSMRQKLGVANIGKYIYNPKTKQYVPKCKQNEIRDEHFNCVKKSNQKQFTRKNREPAVSPTANP